jgi:hypothetical protein
MASSSASHDQSDRSILGSTILHWAVVTVIWTETWAECEMVELRGLWREVEQKHAPADPTLPLIVRCLLRVGFPDRGLKVRECCGQKIGVGAGGSCGRLR